MQQSKSCQEPTHRSLQQRSDTGFTSAITPILEYRSKSLQEGEKYCREILFRSGLEYLPYIVETLVLLGESEHSRYFRNHCQYGTGKGDTKYCGPAMHPLAVYSQSGVLFSALSSTHLEEEPQENWNVVTCKVRQIQWKLRRSDEEGEGCGWECNRFANGEA